MKPIIITALSLGLVHMLFHMGGLIDNTKISNDSRMGIYIIMLLELCLGVLAIVLTARM